MTPPTHSGPIQWVRYEARPMLLGTMALGRLTELAHRRLCDSIWATGELPLATGDAPRRVTRLTPKEWARAWKELQAYGWRSSSGRLSHPWPLQILNEATTFRQLKQSAGSVGGHARQARAQPLPAPPQPAGPPAQTAPHGDPKTSSTKAQADLKHCPGTAQALPKPLQYSNSTVPNTFNAAERLTCSASARAKLSVREKAFMGAVRALFTTYNPEVGRKELENWGGWWRNRFREDPSKAQRVLADIGSMMKEGTIHSNPGATATDLWARLP